MRRIAPPRADLNQILSRPWLTRAHEPPFRPTRGPFPDFAEIFTVREKMRILWRAYRRWGWGGVQGALVREREIHNLLTRERALGLSLIKGTRWLPAESGGDPAA